MCMLVGMDQSVWSPEEAAQLLEEVYAGSLGTVSDVGLVTQEELARALDADPDVLEETWEVWVLMGMPGWTEKQMDDARTWLDVEFLGGLGFF